MLPILLMVLKITGIVILALLGLVLLGLLAVLLVIANELGNSSIPCPAPTTERPRAA